ncbi:hypothetical protein Zmor_008501 [Zophobas morio]|uniref:Uncharacterized protein n=1 Tax=Zophobas morio TaxID=2755281 RepID=A0AA38IWK5_9CUCU|nr:hypothetical protein Zmor_008501 [Zophobas morio]
MKTNLLQRKNTQIKKSKFECPSKVPSFGPSVSGFGVDGFELVTVVTSFFFQFDDSSSVPAGIQSEVWFEHPFSLWGVPNTVSLPNGFSCSFIWVSVECCKDEKMARFVNLVVNKICAVYI